MDARNESPNSFTAGDQVYWCSPNQTLPTGVLLTYRERGEVIGPPHDGRAGCYNVRFENNPSPTTCHVGQLSRALPSRLLAGGYCLGDQLYWCSPNQTLSNGDKLLYGALGEVIGPATSAYPGRVCMLFPGNGPNGIQCDPSELRSEEPSRRGVRSRLREQRHKEPDKEPHGQQPKPEAAADRERVLQQRQEARQRREQELEAALEGGDLECVRLAVEAAEAAGCGASLLKRARARRDALKKAQRRLLKGGRAHRCDEKQGHERTHGGAEAEAGAEEGATHRDGETAEEIAEAIAEMDAARCRPEEGEQGEQGENEEEEEEEEEGEREEREEAHRLALERRR